MVCQTWLTENEDDPEIPGFTVLRWCDRSADETGKTRGGGARVYIINQLCTNVTVRKLLCTEHVSTSTTNGTPTEHVELLSVALCPFYLPTEFNDVCAPPSADVKVADDEVSYFLPSAFLVPGSSLFHSWRLQQMPVELSSTQFQAVRHLSHARGTDDRSLLRKHQGCLSVTPTPWSGKV